MGHVDAKYWKHTTTLDSRRHGEPVGIEFYDDERPGFVSIYEIFADGTRFPCRTVNLENHEHAKSILDAWEIKGIKRGTFNDFRGQVIEKSALSEFAA